MDKNLQLSLKTKWFEMTKAGIKTEDYREVNDYWLKRLTIQPKDITWALSKEQIDLICNNFYNNINLPVLKHYDYNIMTLGYPKSDDQSRIIKLDHKGIEIGAGNPEWGAEEGKLYFVIKHGKIKELT